MNRAMAASETTERVAPRECPACGAEGARQAYRFDKGDHPIWTCEECTGHYVFPLPTEAELKALYDDEEWFEGGLEGGYENYDEQTAPSLDTIRALLEARDPGRPDKMVLDVGCGYGTHLAIAKELGWHCRGVELSDHARGIAAERLGPAVPLAATLADLSPARYDLILVLDVLEHLPDPRALLNELFSSGALGPETRLVISTPNAGSSSATAELSAWQYLHPPSHLIFFTAESLRGFLQGFQFPEVEVRGIAPVARPGGVPEPADGTGSIEGYEGLMVEAWGSQFGGFIQERFVPGTHSKLTDYEHFPRYQLVLPLVAGKRVLDFGCGSGYGSRMLADAAAHVTGVDISEEALTWARQHHRKANLEFVRSETLGAELEAGSFEVVTCFEMIEHVDKETQAACLESLARLVAKDGVLIMSTPNPAITARYGENPYHIHEMPRGEFVEFLRARLPFVKVVDQFIHPAVLFAPEGTPTAQAPLTYEGAGMGVPVAYLGVAGHAEVPALPELVWVDGREDYVDVYLERQAAIHAGGTREGEHRAEVQALLEQKAELEARIEDLQGALRRHLGRPLWRRVLGEVKRSLGPHDGTQPV